MKTWEEAVFNNEKRSHENTRALDRRDMIAGVIAAAFSGAVIGLVRERFLGIENAADRQPATKQAPALSKTVP